AFKIFNICPMAYLGSLGFEVGNTHLLPVGPILKAEVYPSLLSNILCCADKITCLFVMPDHPLSYSFFRNAENPISSSLPELSDDFPKCTFALRVVVPCVVDDLIQHTGF